MCLFLVTITLMGGLEESLAECRMELDMTDRTLQDTITLTLNPAPLTLADFHMTDSTTLCWQELTVGIETIMDGLKVV